MYGLAQIQAMNTLDEVAKVGTTLSVTTVTIGRNWTDRDGDSRELSLEDWEDFCQLTIAALKRHADGDDVVEMHLGTGSWEGVKEDSAKVSLLSIGSLNSSQQRRLQRDLIKLARMYNQQSIALQRGFADLIRP